MCREGVAEVLGVGVFASAPYAGPLWEDSWSQRCSSSVPRKVPVTLYLFSDSGSSKMSLTRGKRLIILK